MAFMMPVMKNDWDIYSTGRSRNTSESAERGGGGGGARIRKVSESRSEGPSYGSPRHPHSSLSPHRSAPAMRSLSYSRPPPSRSSLRADIAAKGKSSPTPPKGEKFHNRLVDKLRKALGREPRAEERVS